MKKRLSFLLLIIAILTAGCSNTLQRPVLEYTISNPAGNGSRFPNLYQDHSGDIYMSWIANVDENIFMFRYAKYLGGGWNEPETIHIGSDYFVQWADFASVAGAEGQPIAAHRYKRADNTGNTYQAELLFRDAETGRWDNQINLQSDQISARQGFVSIEPLSEDTLLAVWLEGGNAEQFENSEVEGMADGLPVLRSAVVTAAGEISMARVIDEAVCGCCQNNLFATNRGYTVVYRGAAAADGAGDVKIAHFDTESGDWSAPESVSSNAASHMQIDGCPSEGPRADASGAYTAVVWYAEGDGNASVNLARSVNPEEGFSDILTVAETEHQPIGRADVLVTGSGEAYVSWMQQGGENAAIMLTRVDAEGSTQETFRVGTTSADTSSGFPGMALAEDAIIIAWTQTSPVFRVRTVRFPLQKNSE